MKAATSNSALRNPHSELPSGWKWVKLGEVCEIDTQHLLPDSREAKKLPYIGLEDVESETGRIINVNHNGSSVQSNTYKFNSCHVLYGKLRPYLNKVALPDFDGRCTTELLPLLPKENCERNYLAYLLRRQETVEEAMRQKTGSQMPRADMKELFKMLIPLPPLPEQTRIAAKIQELMREVSRAHAACEKQLDAARALPSSYLRAVFENGNAKKWQKVRLGNHVTKVGSGITPRGGEASYLKSGVPLIRSQNVLINCFSADGLAFISTEQDAKMNGSRVEKGDVLLNITGASIGRVCVVPSEICPANVNQHVSIIRCAPSLNPEFLALFISNPDFQKYIMDIQSGATRQALTKAIIENFQVPMPSPSEQTRIAAELKEKMAQADILHSALRNQHSALSALPQAISRKAFKGEL